MADEQDNPSIRVPPKGWVIPNKGEVRRMPLPRTRVNRRVIANSIGDC
jgi:hypothetical protein